MTGKSLFWSMLLAGTIMSSFSFSFAHGQAASTEESRLGLLKGTSAVLGKKVGDCHEKTLGKLEDLVLDLAAGEVASTLLSSDPLGRLTPVPALSYSRLARGKMLIEADSKAFESAPQVAKGEEIKALDGPMLASVASHFGLKETRASTGPLSSAARLVGSPVRTRSNEALGVLKEIMVDVPFGRVVYLVVEPGAGIGSRDVLFVVPPAAVDADSRGGVLVLKGDRERFLAGPTFLVQFWADLSSVELARAVQRHYGSKTGSAEKTVATASPTQRPARSDQEITREILGEIARGADGFMKLKIAITTVHGKVTLSGPVKNEKQRRLVLGAAERVVGAENVEDHLTPAGKIKTAQL